MEAGCETMYGISAEFGSATSGSAECIDDGRGGAYLTGPASTATRILKEAGATVYVEQQLRNSHKSGFFNSEGFEARTNLWMS